MSRARLLFCVGLAAPAALMISDVAQGNILAMDLLHPSGEMAVRLMVLAMMPGPLIEFFGANRFLRGWFSIRRNLGVAAFGYALLHLGLYVLDMQSVAAMLDEVRIPGIWTGWLALGLMIPPAMISFDRAMSALGRHKWKRIQQLVYVALAVTLAHWLLLDWKWLPAAVHLTPLLAAWSLRFLKRYQRSQKERITI